MKRLFDLGIVFLSLPIWLPVILIIALSVKVIVGSPVLFRQERPGLNGKLFELVKFRTMRDKLDSEGVVLPDGARMTPFGGFLRSTSLDELPELWNVIKGEMSLVGPRPLLEEYLSLYSEEQKRRHEVEPGITGWAQVNGRNAISWDQKFKLDNWYVDNQSLWLDAKILLLTLKKVVGKENISSDSHVTMEKFTGNE